MKLTKKQGIGRNNMKFTKMHGIGNDYVYVNCFEEEVINPNELAIKVSNRNFGIGSDGLILIDKSDKADFKMRMFNADGSEAQMCGNGIRCVGKYVYDNRMTTKKNITIETLAGIKELELKSTDTEKISFIKVNMGKAILDSDKIPVISESNRVINEKITVDGEEYHITCVSVGNPHAVIFVKNLKDLDVSRIGRRIEVDKRFPERINVEFVEVVDSNNIKMRVWERGAGETLACGTGASASVVACVLNEKTDRDVNVELLGGTLNIQWDYNGTVYMTGPAIKVFDAEIPNEVLDDIIIRERRF